MHELVVKWLVWIIGSVLISAGVITFFLAMFRDRARGRRRCSKCWYDMTGVPPPSLKCPECGHLHVGDAALLRTRRHYRAAAFGLTLILIGYGGFIAHKALTHGWPTAIPSSVLVTVWPISESDWLDAELGGGPFTDPAFIELRERLATGSLSLWQQNWWADRLDRYARRARHYGVDAERETLRRLNASTFQTDPSVTDLRSFARSLHATTGISLDSSYMDMRLAASGSAEKLPGSDALSLLCQSQSAAGGVSAVVPSSWHWAWQWDLDADRASLVYPFALTTFDASRIMFFPVGDIVTSLDRRWNSLRSRADPFRADNVRRDIKLACEVLVESGLLAPDAPFFGASSLVGDRLIYQASPRSILAVESLLDALRDPIDPSRPRTLPANDAAIAAHLSTLEATDFRIDRHTQTVEDLIRAVSGASGIPIHQNFTFVSPVNIDAEARQRLSQASTCANALDEAVRCVSESKIFTAHWYITPSAVRIMPEPIYIPRELRVFDVTHLLPRQTDAALAPSPSDSLRDLQHLISTTIDHENWIDNAGELNHSFTIGTFLLVTAPSRTLIEVERLLAQVQTSTN